MDTCLPTVGPKSSHALLIRIDHLGRLPLPVCVSTFDLTAFRAKLGAPGRTLGVCGVGLCLLGARRLALLALLYLLVPRHVGDVLNPVDECVVLAAMRLGPGCRAVVHRAKIGCA